MSSLGGQAHEGLTRIASKSSSEQLTCLRRPMKSKGSTRRAETGCRAHEGTLPLSWPCGNHWVEAMEWALMEAGSI